MTYLDFPKMLGNYWKRPVNVYEQDGTGRRRGSPQGRKGGWQYHQGRADLARMDAGSPGRPCRTGTATWLVRQLNNSARQGLGGLPVAP